MCSLTLLYMKKILFLAVMAVTVLFTGCKKTSEFNRALNEDYATVQAEYPDSRLYEVQTVFSDIFATEDVENLHVVTSRAVFQTVDGMVLFIDRNLDMKTRTVTTVPGPWLEDIAFIPKDLCDVKDAVEAFYKADIVKPASNLMVLRNPLVPDSGDYPLYIFGSTNTSFVAVDSKSLVVSAIE